MSKYRINVQDKNNINKDKLQNDQELHELTKKIFIKPFSRLKQQQNKNIFCPQKKQTEKALLFKIQTLKQLNSITING